MVGSPPKTFYWGDCCSGGALEVQKASWTGPAEAQVSWTGPAEAKVSWKGPAEARPDDSRGRSMAAKVLRERQTRMSCGRRRRSSADSGSLPANGGEFHLVWSVNLSQLCRVGRTPETSGKMNSFY